MVKRKSAQEIGSHDSPDSDRLRDSKKVRWQGKARGKTNSRVGEREREASTAVGDDEESSDESSQEDESSRGSDNICLAAMCSHGKVGCAYYDPTSRILYVMEDTQDSVHFDLTEMLLEQVNPHIVLTSSKSDDEFIDAINTHMEPKDGTCQIRPFKEFASTKGRDRLVSLSRFASLSLGDDDLPASSDAGSRSPSARPTNAYDFMRSRQKTNGEPTAARWNASVRLTNFAAVDANLCMSSIGALLDHLVRERALGDFDDEGIGGLDIRDIEVLSLTQCMQINADALTSLQIFQDESHASVHSDKTKEGLSLFGLLNDTRTTLGKALLRTWLLRPSLSLEVIRARHDAVECFLRPDNLVTASTMRNHLKGLKNMPRIINLMKSGKAKLADWQGLVKFTFHATMLRDCLSELNEASEVDVATRLMDALKVGSFKEIGIKINETVDWEDSTNNDRVCIRSGIDEDLDNRKHVYNGIDSVLSDVAQQISTTVPEDFATSLNVVYFPQLGYLICVPMLEEWQSGDAIEALEGWTFQFSSEKHVYFKSPHMHDMDVHIGDLHSTIVDRELEIVQDLADDVLTSDEPIGLACDVCAELDCLLSFAAASGMYNYVRPEMSAENWTEIIQGRHPLHEQVVDAFVPNDARIMGGRGIGSSIDPPDDENQWNSLLLCTGANACGKSVYLKQIAVIQIMGTGDNVLTSTPLVLTVSSLDWLVQSAFMIDLAQVSLALRNCTSRSLIVLDEFGKGTLATDGAGLFCGVLRHLLNRGTNCPKVLIATHFHDIFNTDILDPESIPVSFRHMQVMFTSRSGPEGFRDFDDSGNGGGLSGTCTSSISSTPSAFTSPSVSLARGTGTASYSPPGGTSTPRHGREEAAVTLGSKRVIGPRERITYLYRVAEGLSLDSHAAKCAEIFGVPLRIVERAQYVSELLSTHELGRLLDEEMSDKEKAELEEAEAICRRFLAWDINADQQDIGSVDVKRKLAEVLGINEEEGGP